MRDLGPLINKGEKNGLNTWEVYVRGFTVVDPEVSKQINKGFIYILQVACAIK